MKTALILATLAVVACVASATDYGCTFSYFGENNNTIQWDLNPLYNPSQDYTTTDSKMHDYAFQICGGPARQLCNPATWSPTYNQGIAVQLWGAKPSTAGATRDCEVLGVPTAAPTPLMDGDNVVGITLKYNGGAASDSDPFWCAFNPATGAQYTRSITYNLRCDMSQSSPLEVGQATIGTTNDCAITINGTSPYACANFDCVHGVAVKGQCLCDAHWTGAHCNTFSGSCAVGSGCNVCKECCAGYSPSVCAGCVAAECAQPVCSATSSCTACSACCKSFLTTPESCNKCVAANC